MKIVVVIAQLSFGHLEVYLINQPNINLANFRNKQKNIFNTNNFLKFNLNSYLMVNFVLDYAQFPFVQYFGDHPPKELVAAKDHKINTIFDWVELTYV